MASGYESGYIARGIMQGMQAVENRQAAQFQRDRQVKQDQMAAELHSARISDMDRMRGMQRERLDFDKDKWSQGEGERKARMDQVNAIVDYYKARGKKMSFEEAELENTRRTKAIGRVAGGALARWKETGTLTPQDISSIVNEARAQGLDVTGARVNPENNTLIIETEEFGEIELDEKGLEKLAIDSGDPHYKRWSDDYKKKTDPLEKLKRENEMLKERLEAMKSGKEIKDLTKAKLPDTSRIESILDGWTTPNEDGMSFIPQDYRRQLQQWVNEIIDSPELKGVDPGRLQDKIAAVMEANKGILREAARIDALDPNSDEFKDLGKTKEQAVRDLLNKFKSEITGKTEVDVGEEAAVDDPNAPAEDIAGVIPGTSIPLPQQAEPATPEKVIDTALSFFSGEPNLGDLSKPTQAYAISQRARAGDADAKRKIEDISKGMRGGKATLNAVMDTIKDYTVSELEEWLSDMRGINAFKDNPQILDLIEIEINARKEEQFGKGSGDRARKKSEERRQRDSSLEGITKSTKKGRVR